MQFCTLFRNSDDYDSEDDSFEDTDDDYRDDHDKNKNYDDNESDDDDYDDDEHKVVHKDEYKDERESSSQDDDFDSDEALDDFETYSKVIGLIYICKSDPPFVDWHVLLTTMPSKPFSDQVWIRYLKKLILWHKLKCHYPFIFGSHRQSLDISNFKFC